VRIYIQSQRERELATHGSHELHKKEKKRSWS